MLCYADVVEWGCGLDGVCCPAAQGPAGRAGDRAAHRQRLHAETREQAGGTVPQQHRPPRPR